MNRSFPIFRPLALAVAWLLLPTILHAAPGDLAWVRTSLSSANSSADTRALWVDGNDNTYAVGRFVGTVDLFGTTLSATSTSIPSGWAAKFAPDGTPLWVRKLATNNYTELFAACQFGNGEILVGGSASGSFSDGAVSLTIPSTSGQNAFLVRLDPTTGNAVWAHHAGGSGTDSVVNLAKTIGGQIALYGAFLGSITFADTTFTSYGSNDNFIVRVSSDGFFSDIRRYGGPGNELSSAIAVDSLDRTIATFGYGVCSGGNFDLGLAIPCANNSIIFAQYTEGSNAPIWYRAFTNTTTFRANKCAAVTARDEVLGYGFYSGSPNLGGPTNMPTPSGVSGFIVKMDQDGNHLWQKQIGDGPLSAGDQVVHLAPSRSGMVGGIGNSRSTSMAIDGITLTSPSTTQQVFFFMLDPNGTCLWGKKLNGSAGSFGYHVCNFSNNDFVLGGLTSAADFGNGVTIPTGSLNREAFIARYRGFPYPEISALRNGNAITSDQFTAPENLGSAVVGTTASPVTITLRNDGTADLTGIAPSLTGANPGDYVLDASATASTLAPGATTTFTVQFAPTALGARGASVSIASNDYDESPFVVALTGTGLPPEVTVEVSPSSVAEDGAANLSYIVTRNGPTTAPLTVNFSVTGTADAASDYALTGQDSFSAGTGTVTIPIGSASATVTLDPSADPLLEADETAILTLAPGSGYSIGTPAAATGTLVNDDTEVSLTAAPASMAEDAPGTLAFTLTRNGPLGVPLTVNLSVSGSAGFGGDYAVSGADSFSASAATVTFAPGASTAVMEIDPTVDPAVESDESVTLALAPGTGYLAVSPNTATATLVNDDTDVSVTVSPASVLEDGATNLVFTFTRVGVTSGSLTANFSVGGTATGSDYSVSGAASIFPTSGTVSFAPGATTKTVTIDPAVDSSVEADETVILTLVSGSGYNAAAPLAATGTIQDDDTSVSVAVSPNSVSEDGTQNLVFTFTRVGVTSGPLTASFSFGGTAALNDDYATGGVASFAATSGTVGFAAGSATATVTVDPATDIVVEGDETVVLSVVSGNGYTVGGPATATGTIANDDTSVSVAVAPAAAPEDGTTNLVYTFTRSGLTSGALIASFSVTGTASSASDYSVSGAASFGSGFGTVGFADGQTTAVVTVDPAADATVEGDETVVFTVTPDSGYAAGSPAAAIGTISNDDTSVTVSVSPASVNEDGGTNLVYTFTRTGLTGSALTVNFAVSGTANHGADYSVIGAASISPSAGSVTFSAGADTKTVTVDPAADSSAESNETVVFTLAPGSGYQIGSPASGTGTLLDDDTSVSVSVAPSSVTEDGSGTLVYQFSRSGGTTSALTVNFSVGGTAAFGTDYTQSGAATFGGSSGTVSFAAGSATATVTVDPASDSSVESDESVTLTVTSGSGYGVGSPAAATGTITNDDTTVSVAVSPASVSEDGSGNLVYTFTRSGLTADGLAVNFSVGGTAVFGTDYTQSGASSFGTSTGTVIFSPGTTSASVTLDPAADATAEPDETVTLTVTTGSGYSIGTPSAATGTIYDDDSTVSVAVSPASAAEDGATNPLLTFTRAGQTSGSLTVNFTVAGTATFGSDYTQGGASSFTATTGTVTFAAGAATKTVTLDPLADSIAEDHETVLITVVAGPGYRVGSPASATATINNDDVNVNVAVAPGNVAEDGSANLVFTFTRTGSTAGPLTAAFAVSGPAVFGTDYTQSGAATYSGTAGTVVFPSGVSSVAVTVDPSVDGVVEPDEAVGLTVTAAAGYTPGLSPSAYGRIDNDDVAPDIAVFQSNGDSSGGRIANGGARNFGVVAVGSNKSLTFTLTNAGTAPMSGIAASLTGPDAAEFAIELHPVTSLAIGASTNVTVSFTPASPGTKSATLRLASNDPDDNPFDVQLLSDPAASAAENWRRDYFGTTANTGDAADDADPDGDGLTNLIERAFNLNPLVQGRPGLQPGGTYGLPASALVDGAGGKRLRIEFLRRKAATNPGMSWTSQFSSALAGGWADATPLSVTSVNDEWERVVVEDTDGPGQPRRFGRVRVATVP